jgi:hypothetical protein
LVRPSVGRWHNGDFIADSDCHGSERFKTDAWLPVANRRQHLRQARINTILPFFEKCAKLIIDESRTARPRLPQAIRRAIFALIEAAQ